MKGIKPESEGLRGQNKKGDERVREEEDIYTNWEINIRWYMFVS